MDGKERPTARRLAAETMQRFSALVLDLGADAPPEAVAAVRACRPGDPIRLDMLPDADGRPRFAVFLDGAEAPVGCLAPGAAALIAHQIRDGSADGVVREVIEARKGEPPGVVLAITLIGD